MLGRGGAWGGVGGVGHLVCLVCIYVYMYICVYMLRVKLLARCGQSGSAGVKHCQNLDFLISVFLAVASPAPPERNIFRILTF